MLTQVFLSLSFADASFVRSVYGRLPRGLAYFYEKSFENGEVLLEAMERSIAASGVFVLFASKASLRSKAVLFEIDQARANDVFGKGVRLLIFPTDPDITFSDLPLWLQSRWVIKAGWSAPDIARYITTVLLSPINGLIGEVPVKGRGRTADRLDGIVARHLQRFGKMPCVYVLAGMPGVGRRTFSRYYMAKNLPAMPNLPFGPSLLLPSHADAADLYKALCAELSVASPDQITEDLRVFQSASDEERNDEILRLLKHFWGLQQSVTIITSSGLFEDRGEPKEWVTRLLNSLPPEALMFLVTNGKFDDELLITFGNAIQMRVEELSDDDVLTLMIHTAQLMEVKDFKISSQTLKAIGGHPDIANAAVRLVAQKGLDILEKDPAQLMNIQYTILGEVIESSCINNNEKVILDILGWVPGLGGDLLAEVAKEAASVDEVAYQSAIHTLLLNCLITVNGFVFAISPAIRHLYRRRNITPQIVTDALASVIEKAWREIEHSGDFREDVFEASVFVHTMQGLPVPDKLKNLISPGFLSELVRDTYARAKNSEDDAELRRVIALGQLAKTMRMTEVVREEILSTTVRAQIRILDFDAADRLIEFIEGKNYRSVIFLRGHKLRKQRLYPEAITVLREAVRENKFNRAALNELALAYKLHGDYKSLEELLKTSGKLIDDSAILTDFQIGLDLARNRIPEAQAGIERLRFMPDDDGRSDRRRAQLLIKQHRYPEAQRLLTTLLDQPSGSKFLIRTLRAQAAAWAGDYPTSRRDIQSIRRMPGRQDVAIRHEIELFAAQGLVAEAENLLATIVNMSPQDYVLQAKVAEIKADLPSTGMAEAQRLRRQALELKARYTLHQDGYEE